MGPGVDVGGGAVVALRVGLAQFLVVGLQGRGGPESSCQAKAIKIPTKHTMMISTMCHDVRLALLIPKLFLFSILDLAKLCL